MSLVFNYDKDLPKVTPLKLEYLKNQVITLKNIFQPEQKSKEWYEMRQTMLTASDWGTVLGENHYSNSNTVLMKKCGDDTFITNAAMQWGNKYEDVAILVYEHRNNKKIIDFGCIRHPFIPFLGASPDGITPDGIMLEIKCPTSRVIDGIPPRYYWCQVQGQLEVCELDRCDFLECNFKEYLTEDEYISDNSLSSDSIPDYKLNKFGNEKGVIAEFYRKKDKNFLYKYSPVSLLDKELEIWKNNIIKQYITDDIIFSCFSYWYLEIVSCVPIYRNQEWFNTAKVELEIFWNKVIKYRELGLDKLKEDIQNDRLEKKLKKEEIKKEKKVPVKKPKKVKDEIILNYIDSVSNKKNIVIDNITVNTLSSSDEDSDNFISQTSMFANSDDDNDNTFVSTKESMFGDNDSDDSDDNHNNTFTSSKKSMFSNDDDNDNNTFTSSKKSMFSDD